MTSLDTLTQELSSDIVRDPKHRIRSQATKERALNEAYFRIQQDVFNMTDTIEGATIQSWDVVNGTIISVFYGDKHLDPITFQQAQEIREWEPQNYYLKNGEVHTRPNNNVQLWIMYNKIYPKLTNDQWTMTPEYMDYALKCLAWSMLYKQTARMDFANIRQEAYTEAINQSRMFLIGDETLHFI